jgi:hypothetical protein
MGKSKAVKIRTSDRCLHLRRALNLIIDIQKCFRKGKTLQKYSDFICGSQDMLCVTGCKRLSLLFGDLSINVDYGDSPVTTAGLLSLQRKLQRKLQRELLREQHKEQQMEITSANPKE